MKKLIPITFGAILLLSACGKRQEPGKNIDQIQQEQGIPVKVTEIMPTRFHQELTYNAVLSGIEETIVKSMLSDVIVSINARIGDAVKKDQVIVTFPANSPAAQYHQAQSAYTNAKATYERMQRLYAQGAISKQDLENVETGYKVSKANFEATGKLINVTSPIDGVITAMHVNVSEMTFPGQDLFTVAQTNRIKATLWVPESDIGFIKRGTTAHAVVNDNTIAGSVTQIALALDQQNKAFRVECVFPNVSRKLIPGTTSQIRLTIRNIPDAIVVGRKYITQENGVSYVWVLNGNLAIKREIELGVNNQIDYVVTTGLEAGDKLITQGINLLTDNALIRVIE